MCAIRTFLCVSHVYKNQEMHVDAHRVPFIILHGCSSSSQCIHVPTNGIALVCPLPCPNWATWHLNFGAFTSAASYMRRPRRVHLHVRRHRRSQAPDAAGPRGSRPQPEPQWPGGSGEGASSRMRRGPRTDRCMALPGVAAAARASGPRPASGLVLRAQHRLYIQVRHSKHPGNTMHVQPRMSAPQACS